MYCNKQDYGFIIVICLQSYVLYFVDFFIVYCFGEWLKIYILICVVFYVYNFFF